jgi:2'-5' RNA ligase
MTDRHAIVAFPTFDAVDQIEAIRCRFDPLAGLLSAHVTLVFPFKASADIDGLLRHVARVAAEASPFTIDLAEPTVEDGEYLLLPVTEGAACLTALHDRLYSGALRPHLSRTHTYRPHVTVGRLPTSEQAAMAAGEARAMLTQSRHGRIESVAVFRLQDAARGKVEFTIPLGGSAPAPQVSRRAAPNER